MLSNPGDLTLPTLNDNEVNLLTIYLPLIISLSRVGVTYRYIPSNYHCHHSWHVDWVHHDTLLILTLRYRIGRNNLLLPITTYVPSSPLLMALTDTIRRLILWGPFANSFTSLYQRSLYFGSLVRFQLLAASSILTWNLVKTLFRYLSANFSSP